MGITTRRKTPAAWVLLFAISSAYAHQDDPKAESYELPYDGYGYRRDFPNDPVPEGSARPPYKIAGRQAQSDGDEFDSSNMILMSWIPLQDFGATIPEGNDCWGYTSPSGRLYAIYGHHHGTAFVEITQAGAPVIIDTLSGPKSTWRDIKVYEDHAYIVSEGGHGIQVVDLTQIDDGIITHVHNINGSGTAATHNVAINTDSGYLYRSGGSSNGLRIYDLSDPANPEFVTKWSNKYCHDAQIVSYDSGPYAGREIAFCFGGANSGHTNSGISIVDVTDKDNIETITHYKYPQSKYSHQGWLSEDRKYLYVNDELDE